jgi:hypothetical protein
VTVDTSGLSSSAYLYYQFNPGTDITPSATATVVNLTGAVLGSTGVVVDGTYVSGTLPGAVTFTNTGAVNDYNHAVTLGNTLTYNLSFAGGVSTDSNIQSNSVFSFGLFQDENGTVPLITEDGVLYTVALNPDGTTSTALFSDKVTVTPTPIAGAAWMLASGLVGLVGVRRIKR